MSDAFAAYQIFLALRRHFNSEYDYFRYYGKVKTNYEKFLNRNDKYLFYNLSKKADVEGQIISNLILDTQIWVDDVIDKEADAVHKDWMKRVQSLEYNFRQQASSLPDSYKELVRVEDGQYPLLYKLYKSGKMSLESMIVFDSCTDVFRQWNESISDTILWPDFYNLAKKYRPFLPKIDKKAQVEFLKNKFLKTVD